MLIGAVLAVVGSQIFGNSDKAKYKLAKTQLGQVLSLIHI